jgi:hypothetical protein
MRPDELREFFDEMAGLGVEGLMLSPGYAYERAPDQHGFVAREATSKWFTELLTGRRRRGWRFNQTPLFLEFLQGGWHLECTPWGNPTYNVFGWQKPCYLLDEGYCDTFAELLATTAWGAYGQASGNSHCRDCLVHSGYEPTAVAATFSSWRGLLATACLTLVGRVPRVLRPKSSTAVPADRRRDGSKRCPELHSVHVDGCPDAHDGKGLLTNS